MTTGNNPIDSVVQAMAERGGGGMQMPQMASPGPSPNPLNDIIAQIIERLSSRTRSRSRELNGEVDKTVP